MHILTLILFAVVISGHVTAIDDGKLEGKVAVVTGAAKGIGYAITENYLKAGVRNITIVDKNRPRGLLAEKILNSLYGNRVLFIHGDVTTDLDRVCNKIFKIFGYVNILVNNAGIIDEYDPVRTIKTNLLAPILWSTKFFNIMRKDRGGQGGTIMNLASISSYTWDPFLWTYKSSEFGIVGLSVGLGHEYNYLTSGVRVFAMCPGHTYTDLMLKQQVVVDEQVAVFDRVNSVMPWQNPDVVGEAAVVLYKIAATGLAYTIQRGELFVSPDRVNATADFLLSLE